MSTMPTSFAPPLMEQQRGISWLPPVIARGVHAIKAFRKAIRARDDNDNRKQVAEQTHGERKCDIDLSACAANLDPPVSNSANPAQTHGPKRRLARAGRVCLRPIVRGDSTTNVGRSAVHHAREALQRGLEHELAPPSGPRQRQPSINTRRRHSAAAPPSPPDRDYPCPAITRDRSAMCAVLRLDDSIITGKPRFGGDHPQHSQHLPPQRQQRRHSDTVMLEIGDVAVARQSAMLAGRYCLTECIGSGNAGTVWAATDHGKLSGSRKNTGQHIGVVAIKSLDCGLGRSVQRRLATESAAMRVAHHRHVLGVVDTLDAEGALVLELATGGSVFDLAMRKWRHDATHNMVVCRLAAQAATALAHCHAQGVAHGDIKPENLLLAQPLAHEARGDVDILDCARKVADSLSLRLADFGSACTFDPEGKLLHKPDEKGTPQYWPPERFSARASPHAGPGALATYAAADAWALGCVLFACVIRSHPFGGKMPWGGADSTVAALMNRAFGCVAWQQCKHTICEELRAAIIGLLAIDPKERWTPDHVVKKLHMHCADM